MEEKEKLLKEIDILRDNLMKLIEKKENLLDIEIIHVSKLLDEVINEYNNLVNGSKDNKEL